MYTKRSHFASIAMQILFFAGPTLHRTATTEQYLADVDLADPVY